MFKQRFRLVFFIMALAFPVHTHADEGSLVTHMSNLQTFMHKTALALDAQNLPLVKFYAHEIEETIEAVETIEKYKQHNIAAMTKQILIPEFEKFEQLVKENKLNSADLQFNNMIQACNICHTAVQLGFINIKRTNTNPFMQNFMK